MYSVRGRRSLGEKETWYISFVVLRRTGDVERVGTRDLFLFSGKDFVLPQCGGKTKFQYRTRLRRELISFFCFSRAERCPYLIWLLVYLYYLRIVPLVRVCCALYVYAEDGCSRPMW